MSLDIFGQIEVAPSYMQGTQDRLTAIEVKTGIQFTLDSLDEEDVEVLHEEGLTNAGIYFAIHSSTMEPSGTALWNDAMNEAQRLVGVPNGSSIRYDQLSPIIWPDDYQLAMSRTRLGMMLYELASLPHYSRIGIALVDGGIQCSRSLPADGCIKEILRTVIIPWDCGPNALYIWSHNADAIRDNV